MVVAMDSGSRWPASSVVAAAATKSSCSVVGATYDFVATMETSTPLMLAASAREVMLYFFVSAGKLELVFLNLVMSMKIIDAYRSEGFLWEEWELRRGKARLRSSYR